MKDLWVNLDVEVVLERELFIALLHLSLDEVTEGLPDHSVADIDYPLKIGWVRGDDKMRDGETAEDLPALEDLQCPFHRANSQGARGRQPQTPRGISLREFHTKGRRGTSCWKS